MAFNRKFFIYSILFGDTFRDKIWNLICFVKEKDINLYMIRIVKRSPLTSGSNNNEKLMNLCVNDIGIWRG